MEDLAMIDALFDLLGTFYQSGEFAQAEWMARSILQAIPDDLVSLATARPALLPHQASQRRPCRPSPMRPKATFSAVHQARQPACLGAVPAALPARPWLDPGRRLV
jgi:hypothetical protein